MSSPKKKRKRRGKVRLSQRVSLIQKNDATMVKRDTLPQMQIQPPRDNGAVFKVKLKRKNG